MNYIPIGTEWFRGAVSLEEVDQGIMPWRIPYMRNRLYHPGVVAQAGIPVGVRLSFETDSNQIGLKVLASEQDRAFDMVIGQEIHQSRILQAGHDTIQFDLDRYGMKQADIYLCHKAPVTVQSLFIDDGASITPMTYNRPRWTTYGSSITQSGAAVIPAQTWPAIVARSKNWDLTCLGYGGQCHLEPLMATMIRDIPADIISLCLGINVYGGNTLNLRTFRSAVLGMICMIREKQPSTPLVILSPIYSSAREATDNIAGLSLVKMREEIHEAVDILQSYGDRNLAYIDGLDILGPRYSDYLPDQLHPNAEGYRILAGNLLQHPVIETLMLPTMGRESDVL